MITRRELAGLAIGGLIALPGCGWLFPTAKLRYRMTVEITTPLGVRTGSSVIESTISQGPRTGGSSGISYDLRGVAPIVELSDGRRIFALLTDAGGGGDYQARLFNEAIAAGAVAVPPMPRIFQAYEWKEERQIARQIKPTIILPRKLYPILAWFPIPNEAISIQTIDPNEMEKIFGPGVRLKRIYISVTDDDFPSWKDKNLPRFDNDEQFSKWIKSVPYGDHRRALIGGLIRK